MKKSLLLALLTFGCGLLSAQDRKVSIVLVSEPLTLLFQQIQNQSGYNVVYSNEVISDTMLVSVNANRKTVSQLLGEVLPKRQLFYKMLSDGMIVIGSTRLMSKEESGIIKPMLSGRIMDPEGNPIPFASIVLFDHDLVIGGSIGTETGGYQLSHLFVDQKDYMLKVSSIGYESLMLNLKYPDTGKLKQLVLKEELHMLQAVTITSSRPLIERKADRYVVNVDGSALADGNNGLEVLQKSPGIWVGSDGSIRIRGNQSVMVMINDVVQRMSESDLAEYLRRLRSEDISKNRNHC